jgi:hypothetical protein
LAGEACAACSALYAAKASEDSRRALAAAQNALTAAAKELGEARVQFRAAVQGD